MSWSLPIFSPSRSTSIFPCHSVTFHRASSCASVMSISSPRIGVPTGRPRNVLDVDLALQWSLQSWTDLAGTRLRRCGEDYLGGVRVVSWNVRNRVGDAARRLGQFLAALEPRADFVLLQEVNPAAVDSLRETAGLDWLCSSLDRRRLDRQASRRLGVAIGGAGSPKPQVLPACTTDFPERTLAARVRFDGRVLTLATYHAPPGVNWKLVKVQQAVEFAKWLVAQEGPIVLGADANTPEVDALDFALTRTHWHSGARKLNGAAGDDVMWGPGKSHGLEDALRRWLTDRPEELARIAALRPDGPLAVSLRTGGRGRQRSFDRRYDSVWISPAFRVGAWSTRTSSRWRLGATTRPLWSILTLPLCQQRKWFA